MATTSPRPTAPWACWAHLNWTRRQSANNTGKYAERLKPYIADTSLELHAALQAGKTILAEGAQGTLLDIDFGTYPFVTSSSTTAPGALTGLGLGLDAAREARVIGVVKAFQTRVGSGPFPTEVFDDLALRLRGTGEHPWDEYGTTTGRPRRVGWLDGVLLKYAVRINGISELAVTKLDILSGLESIRLCTAYRCEGKLFTDLPFGPADLGPYEPVYEELPGWREDVSAVRTWEDLPAVGENLSRAGGNAWLGCRCGWSAWDRSGNRLSIMHNKKETADRRSQFLIQSFWCSVSGIFF